MGGRHGRELRLCSVYLKREGKWGGSHGQQPRGRSEAQQQGGSRHFSFEEVPLFAGKETSQVWCHENKALPWPKPARGPWQLTLVVAFEGYPQQTGHERVELAAATRLQGISQLLGAS